LELFVGRNDKLKYGLVNINKSGAIVGVFGERGIGKSSYVWQLLNLLSGNKDVASIFNIDIDGEKEKICFYIECTKRVKNLEDLLLEFIFRKHNEKATYSHISLNKIFRNLIQSINNTGIKTQLEYDLNYAEAKIKDNEKNEIDAIRLFLDLTDFLTKTLQKDLVFAIDEVEVVEDFTGIGDFLKKEQRNKDFLEPKVKYIFSGLPKAIEKLREDNDSAVRKIIPIPLDRLNKSDIFELFRNAVRTITNIYIDFTDQFIEKCFDFSDGYPPLVQSFGEYVIDSFNLGYINMEESIINYIDENIFSVIVKMVADNQKTLNADEFSKIRKKINTIGKVSIINNCIKHTGYFNIDTVTYNEENNVRRRINNSIRDINSLIDENVLEYVEGSSKLLRFVSPRFRFILKYGDYTGNSLTYENV